MHGESAAESWSHEILKASFKLFREGKVVEAQQAIRRGLDMAPDEGSF